MYRGNHKKRIQDMGTCLIKDLQETERGRRLERRNIKKNEPRKAGQRSCPPCMPDEYYSQIQPKVSIHGNVPALQHLLHQLLVACQGLDFRMQRKINFFSFLDATWSLEQIAVSLLRRQSRLATFFHSIFTPRRDMKMKKGFGSRWGFGS